VEVEHKRAEETLHKLYKEEGNIGQDLAALIVRRIEFARTLGHDKEK